MKITLSKIQELLIKEIPEHELIKNIKVLSQNFTSNRERIDNYLSDDALVSTYAQFYLLTNLPKLHFLLDQIDESTRQELATTQIVDIGCGPGTYICSLLEYFDDISSKLRITAIDKSQLMLNQAQKIISGIYGNIDITYNKMITFDPEKKYSLIFGHSLNEMGVETPIKYIKSSNPDFIVFIEAGTPSQFKLLSKMREFLIESDYQILYPCLGDTICPMNSEDWCHQRISGDHGNELGRLLQLVHSDRFSMPMIGHIYQKKSISRSIETETNMARILSVIKELKHAFLAQLCFYDNESKRLVEMRAEISKKSIDKAFLKQLKKKEAGQLIKPASLKKISENLLRIEL